ncbi:hypothetical protein D3C71_19040 [compost metagenome]
MFSLIITLISIALVVALALAALYYGGGAFKQGAADAEASKALLQGQQLLGAADLFYADHGHWPDSTDELIEKDYLQSIPMAGAAHLPDQAHAAGVEWQMLQPRVPTFTLTSALNERTCASVNKRGSLGRPEVLGQAYASLIAQCYGDDSFTVVVKKFTTCEGVAPAECSTAPPPTPGDPEEPGPGNPGGDPGAAIPEPPAGTLDVVITASRHDFGKLEIGETTQATFQLTNHSTLAVSPLFRNAPWLQSTNGSFQVLPDGNECETAVASGPFMPGDSCQFEVMFTAMQAGEQQGTIYAMYLGADSQSGEVDKQSASSAQANVGGRGAGEKDGGSYACFGPATTYFSGSELGDNNYFDVEGPSAQDVFDSASITIGGVPGTLEVDFTDPDYISLWLSEIDGRPANGTQTVVITGRDGATATCEVVVAEDFTQESDPREIALDPGFSAVNQAPLVQISAVDGLFRMEGSEKPSVFLYPYDRLGTVVVEPQDITFSETVLSVQLPRGLDMVGISADEPFMGVEVVNPHSQNYAYAEFEWTDWDQVPVITVSPEALVLTSAGSAVQKTFTVSNESNAELTGLTLTKTGASSLTLSNGCPATLAPEGSCEVTVTFAGGADATAQVRINAESAREKEVLLTGTTEKTIVTQILLTYPADRTEISAVSGGTLQDLQLGAQPADQANYIFDVGDGWPYESWWEAGNDQSRKPFLTASTANLGMNVRVDPARVATFRMELLQPGDNPDDMYATPYPVVGRPYFSQAQLAPPGSDYSDRAAWCVTWTRKKDGAGNYDEQQLYEGVGVAGFCPGFTFSLIDTWRGGDWDGVLRLDNTYDDPRSMPFENYGTTTSTGVSFTLPQHVVLTSHNCNTLAPGQVCWAYFKLNYASDEDDWNEYETVTRATFRTPGAPQVVEMRTDVRIRGTGNPEDEPAAELCPMGGSPSHLHGGYVPAKLGKSHFVLNVPGMYHGAWHNSWAYECIQ